MEALGLVPASRLTGPECSVLCHEIPDRFTSRLRAAGRRVDEVRHYLVHQPLPLCEAASMIVEDPQALHRAEDARPPAVAARQPASVQQVDLLQFQHSNDVAVALIILSDV